MVDVLVVGAGPAGATAAALLARQGARVLLVDRARFPRPKLCGDTLNPGAVALLDRLGLADPIRAAAGRLDGMVVTGERGERIEGRYPAPYCGLALKRLVVDAALVAQAVAAGVELAEGVRVRRPLVREGPGGPEVWGVEAVRQGGAIRLPATVTIAADGRRSVLAAALGLTWLPRQPRRWAVGAYFEGVAGLSTLGELHIRPGHYVGIAPLPDGTVNVCLVTSERELGGTPADRLHAAIAADPWLAPRFATAQPLSTPVALGPLAVAARAVGVPGLLLAGDAAGFLDPMTGDGMRFALRGAELAARAAWTMLATGRRDGHRALARWRQREFRLKHRFNRALRWLVDSPTALAAGRRVALIWPGSVRALICLAGDVPRRAPAGVVSSASGPCQ